jgi:dolichol-phosphate mannosyltransferase
MPELAIIVPVFNERDNVAELVARLHDCLRDDSWEVVFVDDSSPDGTANMVREIAQRDAQVRCLQRHGRRGLASACIEGMLSTSAPFCAVMDADLQHDERILPRIIEILRTGEADLVVGSRYVAGGSTGHWSGMRRAGSRIATRLAHSIIKTDVSDPMSGFFALRREILHDALPALSGVGFKILLDVLASTPTPLRVAEVPYVFGERRSGESKLDSLVAWEFFVLLADKRLGHRVPWRFMLVALVGSIGVLLHMMVVAMGLQWFGMTFAVSQAIATMVAMTSHYLLNNLFTHRDRRLGGRRLARGWVTFALACSVGAVANVVISSYIFNAQIAGWASAALSGALVSSVWNYGASSVLAWRAAR